MKRLYIAFFVLSLLLGCVLAAALARNRSTQPPAALAPEEEQLLAVTNHARGVQELPPYRLDPALSKAARETAAALALDRNLYLPPQQETADRIRAAGYVAEDWARNAKTTDEFKASRELLAFLKEEVSSSHIHSTRYEDIGIGIARDVDGKCYIIQLFGKRGS